MEPKKNIALGLLGVLGIWLSNGIAIPLVNKLSMFTPEQLLVARGVVTALVTLAFLRGGIRPTLHVLSLGLCFVFAALCLYNGTRAWGASPTIIIITATPVVNFLVTIKRGLRIERSAVVVLMVMMGAVIVALEPWNATYKNPSEGALWSISGMILNGVFYELLCIKKAPRLLRCFWQAVAVAIIGAVFSVGDSWTPIHNQPVLIAALVGFGLLGGMIYFLSNIVAFDNLDKDIASVLAQGETPAVIIVAVLLGEGQLSVTQWTGAIIALVASVLLLNSVEKSRTNNTIK